MQIILNNVNNVSTTASRIGLIISINKPKADKIPIFIKSLPLKEMTDFKYLGSL